MVTGALTYLPPQMIKPLWCSLLTQKGGQLMMLSCTAKFMPPHHPSIHPMSGFAIHHSWHTDPSLGIYMSGS